jgi:hypothetical protein
MGLIIDLVSKVAGGKSNLVLLGIAPKFEEVNLGWVLRFRKDMGIVKWGIWINKMVWGGFGEDCMKVDGV